MIDESPVMHTNLADTRRLDRRAVVSGAAGVAAAGLAARMGTSRLAAAQAEPATFVLVHGAWAGGWIWRDVIAALREAGHRVYASTATGMGDRAHLASAAIDLDVYITDVVNLLEYEDLTNVTLVGWSFGGMTITGVAERVPERLARLVYLDGELPADGQNVYDADFPVAETRHEVLVAEVTGGIAADVTGFLPITAGIAEWVRASTKDPAIAEWVLGKLTPQPLLTFLQPVRLDNPAAAALPRVFVLCTADKDLEVDPQTNPYVLSAERARSDPGWRVVELADNHLAPLNDPRATAETLISLL